MLTETAQIYCPYCGEKIEIIVDGSIAQQDYTEDCSVCCRPMELSISVSGEDITVTVRREDD